MWLDFQPWRSPAYVPVFIAVFFLYGCTSSETGENLSGIPNDPSNQATVSPTPFDHASQNFLKEWKNRYNELKSEIEFHRKKWTTNGHQTYSFVASKDIGGVSSPWNRSPVLINVVDGKAVSKELVSKGDVTLMARTDGFEEFDTVDKLFDYMQTELDSGHMVKAEYDPNLHYPTFVSIMFSYTGHGARSITIKKLKLTEK